MEHLTIRDRELVAIGAALASNCIPCTESHITKARQAGLSDSQIREAVDLADKLRQTPAAKVLETARTLLAGTPDTRPESAACCGG